MLKAQALAPSFFNLNGGPYVVAQHGADNSLVGSASFSAPGYPFTPAKPGETVVLYANGLGPTSTAVVGGSETQSGTLSPLPVVSVSEINVQVKFAGLVSPGLFQLNVVIPTNVPSGDNALTLTYNGTSAAPAGLITVQASAAAPTSTTLYVAPNGNDSWSGRLATSNSTNSDGPIATFGRARTIVQQLNKSGLTQVNIQFRAGTYFLPATEMFTAADSGSSTTQIVYQNYPSESPVLSGGVRLQNWINSGGNTWKTTLPASMQYFENLFYNGVRRLRPRLGIASTGASGATLGTYYRYVGPVYINTPGPPAAAPDPNCSVYFAGSGWSKVMTGSDTP